jgi:hypothetical protein
MRFGSVRGRDTGIAWLWLPCPVPVRISACHPHFRLGMNPPHERAPRLIVGLFIRYLKPCLEQAFEHQEPVRALPVLPVEQCHQQRIDPLRAFPGILGSHDGRTWRLCAASHSPFWQNIRIENRTIHPGVALTGRVLGVKRPEPKIVSAIR